MNRAEIIEGLKDIYGTLYAYIPHRKVFDLKIIEACLELLENENALIDKVLEIIESAHFDLDDLARERDVYMRVSEYRKWMKKAVFALKGDAE